MRAARTTCEGHPEHEVPEPEWARAGQGGRWIWCGIAAATCRVLEGRFIRPRRPDPLGETFRW